MKSKDRRAPYENGRELFDDSFQVASMSDCTGLIPAMPETDAELSAYSQIYDIPLPNHKNERRKTMNDQNKNNNRKDNNQNSNRKDNNQNQNKKNDSNKNDRSFND